MKQTFTLIILFSVMIANGFQSKGEEKISIIPIPAIMVEKTGTFSITEKTTVILSIQNEETELAQIYINTN